MDRAKLMVGCQKNVQIQSQLSLYNVSAKVLVKDTITAEL